MKYRFLLLFIFFNIFAYLPLRSEQDSTLYAKAVDEIVDMLNGKTELSFKRAVYLSENAYSNGKIDWKDFCNDIEVIKNITTRMVKEKGLINIKTAGNWAIFSYMTEKIKENNFSPYLYDFENFMGEKDFDSFMVSNLLKSKKGNCRSLPYLYKILAEEIGAESFLALAPMHIYIRQKDQTGTWWNLELTSGSFSRTSFIIEEFGVKDAAIESGLYMKPLSLQESVALCLSDLLSFYKKNTGIETADFITKAYTEGLKVYPNSLLLIAKKNDLLSKIENEMKIRGLKNYNEVKPFPELAELYTELETVFNYIVKIGFPKNSELKYKEKIEQIQKEQEKEKLKE